MPISIPHKTRFFQQLRNIFLLSIFLPLLIFTSCKPFGIIPKHYQKDKPFVTKNSIEVKGGKFTKDELIALKSRLNAQLDDSSKINVVDHYFFRHVYNSPAAFDTASAAKSAKNMQSSMLHLGYYRATATYKADTIKRQRQQRVHVHYSIVPDKPTRIDTTSYLLKKNDLQQIALLNAGNSLLKETEPVTKSAVLGEISRLTDIYRNESQWYKLM